MNRLFADDLEQILVVFTQDNIDGGLLDLYEETLE